MPLILESEIQLTATISIDGATMIPTSRWVVGCMGVVMLCMLAIALLASWVRDRPTPQEGKCTYILPDGTSTNALMVRILADKPVVVASGTHLVITGNRSVEIVIRLSDLEVIHHSKPNAICAYDVASSANGRFVLCAYDSRTAYDESIIAEVIIREVPRYSGLSRLKLPSQVRRIGLLDDGWMLFLQDGHATAIKTDGDAAWTDAVGLVDCGRRAAWQRASQGTVEKAHIWSLDDRGVLWRQRCISGTFGPAERVADIPEAEHLVALREPNLYILCRQALEVIDITTLGRRSIPLRDNARKCSVHVNEHGIIARDHETIHILTDRDDGESEWVGVALPNEWAVVADHGSVIVVCHGSILYCIPRPVFLRLAKSR